MNHLTCNIKSLFLIDKKTAVEFLCQNYSKAKTFPQLNLLIFQFNFAAIFFLSFCFPHHHHHQQIQPPLHKNEMKKKQHFYFSCTICSQIVHSCMLRWVYFIIVWCCVHSQKVIKIVFALLPRLSMQIRYLWTIYIPNSILSFMFSGSLCQGSDRFSYKKWMNQMNSIFFVVIVADHSDNSEQEDDKIINKSARLFLFVMRNEM